MVVSEEEFNNDIDAIALDSVNNDTMADSKEEPVGENEVSNKMVQSYDEEESNYALRTWKNIEIAFGI